ncbi:MAG: hypothetical protein JRN21_09520 [Nitrososphaerota archaeon]|nr:hypothetical protein [Nitrososphaerota archaeon]
MIKKIDGSKRKKRLVSVVRKFQPDKEQMKAVIAELKADPLMDPFVAITKVRKGVTKDDSQIVINLRDSRVVKASQNAALATNASQSENATEAYIEWLTSRSYLSRNVVEQLETLQFVEEELGTSEPD